ncbi:sulfite reductase subunit alpha [Niveibacterium sp. SC-1]|uniref:sulfite reductase subunit alpha n=1 Tax=Niveibacterium sp. SC-1 TaxID=3135646 RepID=UPI00311F2B0A
MSSKRLMRGVTGAALLGLSAGAFAAAGPGTVGSRQLAALVVALAYLLFSWSVLATYRRRDAARRAGLVSGGGEGLLLAYASQTGYAESLALRSADALNRAGRAVELRALNELDEATLARHRQALFIASTTGEGDAPDNAARFARELMARVPALGSLQFGVLALGDRSYAHFCGFGRALDRWLRHAGAVPLFDPVEVDNADAGALRHWQQQLSALGGHAEMPDWRAPDYGRWQLLERRLLNPGSQGGPAYHIALRPLEEVPVWQAGDIVELGPRNAAAAVTRCLASLALDGTTPVRLAGRGQTLADALACVHLPQSGPQAPADLQDWLDQLPLLPHREYSIASLPWEGQLDLLVRQMRGADGQLGLGSGWLTAHARVGGEIALRIRSNRSFHPPTDARPLILIGNGTGLAGLRAHLKARAAAGHERNWLLFGERNRAHDAFHHQELATWLERGVLARLDLVFSRDQPTRRYVQDQLREAADMLREWIAQDAAIYVCGSLEGMAAGVHAALIEILGASALEALTDAGRYRRDLY